MENHKRNSSGQDDGRIVISTGKLVTIETAADFTQRIKEGLSVAKSIAISFDAEVKLDITVLQILCSACKTAAAEDKSFSYCNELPKSLIDLVTACGAEFHGACKHNNNNICIWFGDGK